MKAEHLLRDFSSLSGRPTGSLQEKKNHMEK